MLMKKPYVKPKIKKVDERKEKEKVEVCGSCRGINSKTSK